MGSEPRIAALPGALGRVRIHTADARRSLLGMPHPHARLADGRTVVWEAPDDRPENTAVDAEAIDTPADGLVGARLGEDGVERLRRWTRLEVVAKLTRIPALLLLRGARWPSGLAVETVEIDDLIVSVGWRTGDAATRE